MAYKLRSMAFLAGLSAIPAAGLAQTSPHLDDRTAKCRGIEAAYMLIEADLLNRMAQQTSGRTAEIDVAKAREMLDFVNWLGTGMRVESNGDLESPAMVPAPANNALPLGNVLGFEQGRTAVTETMTSFMHANPNVFPLSPAPDGRQPSAAVQLYAVTEQHKGDYTACPNEYPAFLAGKAAIPGYRGTTYRFGQPGHS